MLCDVFVGSTRRQTLLFGLVLLSTTRHRNCSQVWLSVVPLLRIAAETGRCHTGVGWTTPLGSYHSLALMFHDHEMVSWADAVATCCACTEWFYDGFGEPLFDFMR